MQYKVRIFFPFWSKKDARFFYEYISDVPSGQVDTWKIKTSIMFIALFYVVTITGDRISELMACTEVAISRENATFVITTINSEWRKTWQQS